VQLYRYFVSQSSESSQFCRHNTLCCFSTSVYCCHCCCLFRYRLSPETFGYIVVLPATVHAYRLTDETETSAQFSRSVSREITRRVSTEADFRFTKELTSLFGTRLVNCLSVRPSVPWFAYSHLYIISANWLLQKYFNESVLKFQFLGFSRRGLLCCDAV
jgi:hypothetical protein